MGRALQRIGYVTWCGCVCVSLAAYADGPAGRMPTDPHTVTSAPAATTAALPVEALLTTTRITYVARSNNGRKFAYTSNANRPAESLGHERGRYGSAAACNER